MRERNQAGPPLPWLFPGPEAPGLPAGSRSNLWIPQSQFPPGAVLPLTLLPQTGERPKSAKYIIRACPNAPAPFGQIRPPFRFPDQISRPGPTNQRRLRKSAYNYPVPPEPNTAPCSSGLSLGRPVPQRLWPTLRNTGKGGISPRSFPIPALPPSACLRPPGDCRFES